ncbi:EamA family transporter [Natronobeatus ordinarius]|uniref:EamA family transporter n=1 Tax=Natronobeatus ordinarius TaxID=2963433 RepID=UPI0020CBEBB9|nr:EamA family transporter [Natronobeatus ordinarius]
MTSAPLEVVVLALVPAVFWGFAPIFDKRGMAAGGDSVQASLVVVLVELVIYWTTIVLFYRGGAFTGLTTEVLLVFVFAGVIGTALGRITIFVGVDRVGASLNSAILSTRPLFATVIALAALGEPLGPVTAVGIVILVFGLSVLALSRGGDLEGWTVRDLLWPIAAAATFAVANVARRYGMLETPITALEAVTINETAGLIALLAYVLARGRTREMVSMPRETYVYFLGSGLLTTVAMLSLMAALGLEEGRIAIVDPLVATAPFFTILFAAVLLRDLERVTRGVVVGATLIVVGAVLITI